MIKIEVLYPEYMNLYGDNGNIRYLEQSNKDITFIYTNLNDQPTFISKKVDMLYLGPCTENNQEEIIKLLLPHKDKIKELIEKGMVVLATGNALEIFGKYIEDADGNKIKALNLFDVYTKRLKNLRHNELCLGVTKEGFEIVGFKNQLSHLYGNDEHYFQDIFLGTGRNKDEKIEGINYKNFIGTYILGPILVLNPLFTKYLLSKLEVSKPKLAFEEDTLKAYEFRLKEFKKLIKDN